MNLGFFLLTDMDIAKIMEDGHDSIEIALLRDWIRKGNNCIPPFCQPIVFGLRDCWLDWKKTCDGTILVRKHRDFQYYIYYQPNAFRRFLNKLIFF